MRLVHSQACPRCERPLSSTWICRDCRHRLEVALGNIAAYYADLTGVVRPRLTRYSVSGGARGKPEGYIGMDLRFAAGASGAKAETTTRRFLARWIHEAMTALPPVAGPVCDGLCDHGSCRELRRRRTPRDTVQGVCGYLAGLLPQISGLPWSAAMLTQALDCEATLERIIDRPADRWYAGPCGWELDGEICTRKLWAEPGETYVRCRDCGCTWDVRERREWLLDHARDEEATVEQIARFVATVGDGDLSLQRFSARIRQWAARGRIEVVGHRDIGGRERPTYRIGDVLDLCPQLIPGATA